jgi:hypothetical protein
LVPPLPVQVSV